MSIGVVQPHYIFGVNHNVSGAISYLDEQTILFPSGNQFVRFNIDQKQQKFIPGSDKCEGMTSVALSPNRRYVAIAERGERPQVTVWDLVHDGCKKRKLLTHPDLQATSFTSVAFSPDSKYVVAQSDQPDWLLVYWAWEKGKVMASVKTTLQNAFQVNQISFNPRDNTQICVSGNQVFKLYRYSEGSLKQFGYQKSDPQNCLCHSWLSEERVVVGTESGRLMVIENGEVKLDFLADMPAGSLAEASSRLTLADGSGEPHERVSAVVAYSKGFACACQPGTVHLYEKIEDHDVYKKMRIIRIELDPCNVDPQASRQQAVTSLCISPSEEVLVAATASSQLYSASLSSADMGKVEEGVMLPLTHSFHSQEVTGLDVCIRKPLIATCAIDCSIRIWNFETSVLELYKVFQEEAYSVAIHPSGLYILAGFNDKLRLMNLLIDDIRIFKDFTIRGCRECAFSHGGHLFAAVHGTVIQLFSSTTFENVLNFKGHNGKIRSFQWSADDSKLVSCGMDGAVYEWSTSTGKRVNENVLKTCAYSGVAVSPSGKHSYVVGNDLTIKEMTESSILRTVSTGESPLSQIVMSHSGRMLFCGANSGALRSIKFPISEAGEFTESFAHSKQITKMRITFDDQFLITVSEDGCVLLWKIIDKEGRGVKLDKESAYAEEILITKSDLEEKNQLMAELKTRVEELKMENEYQLRLKDMNYNEKIKELTEKFIQEMENLKTKNQVLKTEKEKEIAKHEEEIAEVLDRHGKDMQDTESTNNQKLMLEYEKYQELQGKSQRMQEDYERQLQEGDEAKEQALEELTEYYETKLEEKTTMLEQSNHEMRQQHKEYEETKRQIEEDADREILDMKNKYERRLRDEIETNMRLKGESGIMRKKFNSLNREIDVKNDEIRTRELEKTKLDNVIKSLDKDIHGLKKEIQERDETIQDKEKRIYDLKKKNQELEKFKFVLDYKIKELKKQIEPRENDIRQMKEQIQEMESELERFHKQNTTLELNIGEMKEKLRSTDKEYQLERQRVRDGEAMTKRLKTEIHNCVGLIQDPKKLKQAVRDLYINHVGDYYKEVKMGMDEDLQREYARQREHLERSVVSLRKKMSKDSEIHRADNVRVMQENVSLIREINELRRELKMTRTELHDIESAIGSGNMNAARYAQNNRDTILDNMSKQSEVERVKRHNIEEQLPRIIDMQKLEIARLRQLLADGKKDPSVGLGGGGGGAQLPPMTTA